MNSRSLHTGNACDLAGSELDRRSMDGRSAARSGDDDRSSRRDDGRIGGGLPRQSLAQ